MKHSDIIKPKLSFFILILALLTGYAKADTQNPNPTLDQGRKIIYEIIRSLSIEKGILQDKQCSKIKYKKLTLKDLYEDLKKDSKALQSFSTNGMKIETFEDFDRYIRGLLEITVNDGKKMWQFMYEINHNNLNKIIEKEKDYITFCNYLSDFAHLKFKQTSHIIRAIVDREIKK